MSSRTVISRDAISAVDPSGQLAEVADLGVHLQDALWRVESANISGKIGTLNAPDGVIVAASGAASAGGPLVNAALGRDRVLQPITTVSHPNLPRWTSSGTVVICASYSGDAEETLSAYDQAGEVGATRIVATTGGRLAEKARADRVPVIPLPAGFEPRSAVGYWFGIVAEVAAIVGAAESLRGEIDGAAALVGRLVAEWGPDQDEESYAKELAHGLRGFVPVIAGAGLTLPAADRWAKQINATAKLHAFAQEVGYDHVLGWDVAWEHGAFAAIFLDDVDLPDGLRDRIEAERQQIGKIPHPPAPLLAIRGEGETRTERLMSLVLLGDLLALYLAVLRGVDPAAGTSS